MGVASRIVWVPVRHELELLQPLSATSSAPLAIEGLMAFFLEATFVGLFFPDGTALAPRPSGRDMGGRHRLQLLSALWILIANGWMQNPVGSSFNPPDHAHGGQRFCRRCCSIRWRKAKFIAPSRQDLTAAIFVLGVSAWYLLKGRHLELAKRSSLTVAASFGLARHCRWWCWATRRSYLSTEHQRIKTRGHRSDVETRPAPAAFTAIGRDPGSAQDPLCAVHIPWVMGLSRHRS